MESIVWAVIAFQIFLDAAGLALIAGALLMFAVALLSWMAAIIHLALDWLAGRIVRLKGINRDFIFLMIGLSVDARNWVSWLILGVVYLYLRKKEAEIDDSG